MEPLEVFTVRDLRRRTGELFKEAEKGRLSLITKHGRPAILAVPFDERLLEQGVHRALALHLFESGRMTLAQSARLTGVPVAPLIQPTAPAFIYVLYIRINEPA